jgi:hypothetical protein
MKKPQISERETVEKLLMALQELPDVHTQPPVWEANSPNAHNRIDAEIDLNVSGRDYILLVEVKKSVFPRDVREVLWQFSQLQNHAHAAVNRGRTVVPLLAAEAISPGAKELLKKENVGYYDTGGSLFISARGAYFYIEKPPPRALSKLVRVLFKGKRSQVLHALLHKRDEWFGVKTLAEIAKVSPATASETLTALERFNWLASRGRGPSKQRRLAEPGALLDEWKKQVLAGPQLPARRYYVSAMDSDKLTNRLGQICEAHNLEYAITQEAAGQRYVPFLSSISRVSCRMAPGRAAAALIDELDARGVTEGANLLVIETRSQSELLFKERVDSIWLANPIQVYLDLLQASGRSQEMAEHLRRERIGF